jgi:hypothetical protein
MEHQQQGVVVVEEQDKVQYQQSNLEEMVEVEHQVDIVLFLRQFQEQLTQVVVVVVELIVVIHHLMEVLVVQD